MGVLVLVNFNLDASKGRRAPLEKRQSNGPIEYTTIGNIFLQILANFESYHSGKTQAYFG
jgi:hypothetical protein